MKIPDEFELPRPEDFCGGSYFDGQKACSLGWLCIIFGVALPGKFFPGAEEFETAYIKEAKRSGINKDSIASANDAALPAERARFFEAGIRAMGYEITNG